MYKVTVKYRGKVSSWEENFNAIAHYCPTDVPGFMAIEVEDHTMHLVNLTNVKEVVIDKELWYIKQREGK